MSHARALCFTTLFSLILSSTIAAAPARKNLTKVFEQRNVIDHRYYAEPDEEGWTHYSSVGLMLPMQERDCEVIGCEEHFATPPTLPGFQNGFQERSLSNMPASGHRDIIRRTGAVSFDNKTGEPSYVLHDHRYQHYPENDKVEAKHETPSVNPYADSSQGGHGLLSLLKRKSTISKSKRSSKTSKKGKSGKSKTGNALLSAVADVMSGATILLVLFENFSHPGVSQKLCLHSFICYQYHYHMVHWTRSTQSFLRSQVTLDSYRQLYDYCRHSEMESKTCVWRVFGNHYYRQSQSKSDPMDPYEFLYL